MHFMDPAEVPWIDEAGYWHKRLFIGKHYIDLSVGSRVQKDGS